MPGHKKLLTTTGYLNLTALIAGFAALFSKNKGAILASFASLSATETANLIAKGVDIVKTAPKDRTALQTIVSPTPNVFAIVGSGLVLGAVLSGDKDIDKAAPTLFAIALTIVTLLKGADWWKVLHKDDHSAVEAIIPSIQTLAAAACVAAVVGGLVSGYHPLLMAGIAGGATLLLTEVAKEHGFFGSSQKAPATKCTVTIVEDERTPFNSTQYQQGTDSTDAVVSSDASLNIVSR